MGADIPESTLVGWCGRDMKALQPLIEGLEADIMASDLLHADDTPIRVLDRSLRDKGLGKGLKRGRIWAYVRDQRPWAGASPPGAVYRFAPDWKEEHVLSHLADARGILQAPSRDNAVRCPARRWTVTRAMPSFMSLNPTARRACVKRPVGPTCGVTSKIFGHQPNPRSPAKRSTGLARSTASNVAVIETAKLNGLNPR